MLRLREGWAISNSEKEGSSGVGYVRVAVIWRGRGREGIFVLFPYTVEYFEFSLRELAGRSGSASETPPLRMHMRGSSDDEMGMPMCRSWVKCFIVIFRVFRVRELAGRSGSSSETPPQCFIYKKYNCTIVATGTMYGGFSQVSCTTPP